MSRRRSKGCDYVWLPKRGDSFKIPNAPKSTNRDEEATSITFVLGEPGLVRLTVLDIQGRRVRTLLDGHQPAGTRAIQWDGTTDADESASQSQGVYFVRLETREAVRAQKVLFQP